jgi:hypothetical protein
MNIQAVEDWLQVRRELLDMEMAFTTLAIKVANGDETEELLQERREVLEAQRELCAAAYRHAFPKQSGSAARG